MRFWLILLMVATLLPSVPLLRSSIKKSHLGFLSELFRSLSRSKTAAGSSSRIHHCTTLQEPHQHFNMTTGISSTPDAADAVPCSETIEDQLPKLSASDFRIYNKQAEMMNYYHNHFRQSWRTLYSACENNARPKGMTILQFMNVGIQLCHHLNVHHGIEEQHIFPVLAQRMPEFSHSAKPASDPRARLMVQQHKQIHAGLERLEKYLDDCKSGNLDFKLTGDEGSLKEVMDSFGAVLWEHLDEEVRLLGAQNMRKYWSKQEMQNMNW